MAVATYVSRHRKSMIVRLLILTFRVFEHATAVVFFPFVVLVCGVVGTWRRLSQSGNRAVTFGGCGIINLSGWSAAVQTIGISSETVVWSTPKIYDRKTFDRDLLDHYGIWAGILAPIEFLRSVSRSRIIVCGFDGFILGISPLKNIELRLLHLAGCKVVVSPYGGDSYVYAWVRNESLQHALQLSYPDASRRQREIARRAQTIIEIADFVMPGVMGFDGLGRWDVLAPSLLVVDPVQWQPAEVRSASPLLRVTHTPNHRGFKGTEFLVKAVHRINAQGPRIALQLLEGASNEEVRRVLTNETDVLVEQLIYVGYAMSGVEGLATGNVVVSNLADPRITEPLRRWTFLRDCPIISATPETIESVLENLLELRSNEVAFRDLQQKSRDYAVNWHSPDTFGAFFVEVVKVLFGERDSVMTYFNPE